MTTPTPPPAPETNPLPIPPTPVLRDNAADLARQVDQHLGR